MKCGTARSQKRTGGASLPVQVPLPFNDTEVITDLFHILALFPRQVRKFFPCRWFQILQYLP